VVTFARKYLNYTGEDDAFDFSAAYDPISAFGARLADGRVWSFFRKVADGMDAYLPYIQGHDLQHRMPLTVPLKAGLPKLSVNDTLWHMRSHNEGSWFDNTQDVGAEAFHAPYRWRPLMWQVGPGGHASAPKAPTYVHERTIGYHVTAWHFVAQCRQGFPKPIGGVFWFGVDDTATSANVPFYCGSTAVPDSWATPRTVRGSGDTTYNGDVTKFNWDAAWWAFNVVANYAYERWSYVYPVLAATIKATEEAEFKATAALDAELSKQWAAGDTEGALAKMTNFGLDNGDAVVKQWQALFGTLFARFRDGGVTEKAPVAKSPGCGCSWTETGYDQKWYTRIVKDTGTHYLLDQPPSADDLRKLKLM